MKKLIALTLACLVISFLAAPGLTQETSSPANSDRPVRDKWALVVGIGEFQNAQVPRLKYATKDAADFRNFLINEANFAPDHVRLLLNEKATQRRVLSELGNKYLARVAKPDDLVVLYFSTHGSPSQFDIRGKNFIVAHDSDPDDLFTTGIEMDKIMESIKSRLVSDRVLLVLDACHSGAVSPNAKGLKRVGNFDAEELMQGSGQLVICSSAPDQQSWESKRYNNGIFTRKLIEGLRINGRKTRLAAAFNFASQSVSAEAQEDYAARQSPSLKSKWNGNDLVLAVEPQAPQALPQAVKEILEPDSTVAFAPLRPAFTPAQRAVTPPAGPPKTMSAAASVNNYEKGVSAYDAGNFGSAVTLLTAATRSTHAMSPDAHYHLANSLIKINRVSDAVSEYRKCYVLEPKGRKADYCLQMINYYSGARHTPSAPAPAAQGQAPQAVAPPPQAQQAAGKVKTNDEAFKRVKSNLPSIPSFTPESPTLSEFLNWSTQERANYVNEATSRVERARAKLTEAEELLTRAQSFSRSLIPTARGYGESESQFQARLKVEQSREAELLAPYHTAIDVRTRIVADENNMLESSRSALRTIRGY